MIKISKKSQYGLRAMVCLAKSYKSLPAGRQESQVLSIKKISEKEGVPFEFLEKIVRQLAEAKLVKGKKGVQGGYILARSPAKITTEDIVSVLEGKESAVNCALCGKAKKCMAKNVWKKIDIAINKTLKSITLKDLIS
jgi:Rrf2 family protein